MAHWLGWIAALSIVIAAAIPVGVHLQNRKRAAPDSPPIRLHVVIGTVTALLAFAHTLAALADLGSPAAIGGGFLALMTGGVALTIVIAHAGIGLQLRNVRLRDRVRQRRRHVGTAIAIATVVTAHVWLLRSGTE